VVIDAVHCRSAVSPAADDVPVAGDRIGVHR
jgi:hypothetical protein